MGRLVYLFIALYAAIHFGDRLTAVLWFLPIADLLKVLTPKDLLSRGVSFYVNLILWTAVLFVVLRSTGLVFLPAGAQKYGETKAARFIKGLLAEGVVLGLFSVPVFWVIVTCGGKSVVLSSIEQDLSPEKAHLSMLPTFLADVYRPSQDMNREQAWERATPWYRAAMTVRYLWALALPFALTLHIIFHRRLKRRIARIAEPLIRFRDAGRVGHGGSGRFAGILDEWLLL